MVRVAPVDEVIVQVVGTAVGVSVQVRPDASVTLWLPAPFGSVAPEKVAPSSAVTVSSSTPLPVAPTKTSILPVAGSTARSRLSVTQMWRTGGGTEPLVRGSLPARYSVLFVAPSPSESTLASPAPLGVRPNPV